MRVTNHARGFGGKLLAFALTLSALAQAAAQQPQQPVQSNQDEEEVVRITSNLIQVDAVVLDSRGRQVTDLTADDFELTEDGRAQSITNFSYVDASPDAKAAAEAKTPARGSAAKAASPVAPARVRAGDARRRIAFVVDDLGLTFQATAYVRNFLKDFVKDQMRPGDLVAVVRTSAGVGALQQFTSDPRLVQKAIERVRFQPGFRAPTGAFAAAAEKLKDKDSGKDSSESEKDNNAPDRDALFTVGTLGALNYVLRGAAEMPGRKSVVLISQTTRLFKLGGRDADVREYLQRMTDLANRASTSVYELDASDLAPEKTSSQLGIVQSVQQAPGPVGGAGGIGGRSPSDAFAGSNQPPTPVGLAESLLTDRELNGDRSLYETKTALRYLAKQTGGARVFGIERVLEDQRGYYLIGYRPDEKNFDPQKAGGGFHNIALRVKRPGLRVRHRTGFYSGPDADLATSAPTTREGRLLRALTSPLASGSIPLSLTPLFGNDAQTGSFVRALIHVEARGLKFNEEPGGARSASLEVLAVTLGETGKPLDQADGVETIRVAPADFEKFMAKGLRYTLKVPIKSPGAYQLRVAVLDVNGGQVGSANELIEVPDIGSGRLALSGLVLSGRPDASAPSSQAAAPQTQPDADAESDADPAVRRLRAGMELRYDFHIYNAQLDPATGRPRLQTQVRLFREGQLAYEGKLSTFDTQQHDDLKRLVAGGGIKLSRTAAPGEYVTQLVVTDLLAKPDRGTATQWLDFEIVR
ncbi:MAG TPA: VWA domain-containing protein [Pyrinomonadaceae bacterium]|nr:VWA domain-containing protein [Pyrinomonadaceae bacterium]